jgi:outer membrane protein OmpA-like peptidoglycan-associated protein
MISKLKKYIFFLFSFFLSAFSASAQCFLMSDTIPFVISKMDKLNSAHSDMAGCVIDSVLYFSSTRDANFDKRSSREGSVFYELYKVQLNENDLPVGEIKKNAQKGVFGHDVIHSYNSKTGEIFVSRSNVEDTEIQRVVFKKEYVHIRIVILKIDGGKVITEEFPYNNSLYNVAHPAISSSGDTLYFSSDKDGSMDLYYSVRNTGKWGVPHKLSNKINTEKGNEVFPFVDNVGTLYYSSDGYAGAVGGLDIFFATRNEKGFNQPEIFKNVLNSTADDFAFFLAEGDEVGYFSSNREGGLGDDDIYMLKVPMVKGRIIDYYSRKPIVDVMINISDRAPIYTDTDGNFNCVVPGGKTYELLASKSDYDDLTTNVTSPCDVTLEMRGHWYLELVVLDEKTRKPVNNVSVSCELLGDKFTQSELGKYEAELGYNKEYEITVKNNKYFASKKTVSTIGEPYGTIQDTILLSNTLTLNIMYDFNSANIRKDAAEELDRFAEVLKEVPGMAVELGAHTDSRGSDEYNLQLSERRAQSAVDYIISKGIDADRVISKGYGETQPLIDCYRNCTEEMHQANRRTEIKIIDLEE